MEDKGIATEDKGIAAEDKGMQRALKGRREGAEAGPPGEVRGLHKKRISGYRES